MINSNFQYIKDVTSEFKNQMDATYSYVESLASIANSLKKNEFDKSEDSNFETIEKIFEAYMNISRMMSLMKSDPKKFYNDIKKIIEDKKLEGFELLRNEDDRSVEDINKLILNEFIRFQNTLIEEEVKGISLVLEDDNLSFRSSTAKFHIKLKKYLEIFEKQANYKELLLKTSLLSVSNSFESLINNLIFLIIRNDENSLKNKQLSFGSIERFDTIEELKESMIEEAVQDILRGNQQSWLDYISDKTGNGKIFFKKQEFDEEKFEEFEEFFLYRNLITHNNSTINNTYINKVKKYKKNNNGYKVGDKLVLTEKYLLDHLDLIYFVAVKTCYLLGYRFCNEDKNKMFEFLSDIAYDNLKERPQLSVLIYEMLSNESSKHQMSERMLFSINYLQALKWNHDMIKFEKLYKDLDFSTASSIHKLCLDILNDDFAVAVVDLKASVETNPFEFFEEGTTIEMRLQHLVEWPIFKKFKASEEFKEYLKSVNLDNEIIYIG